MALSLTAFIVLRVFWITLGLWAKAKPAASTQARIVIVGVTLASSCPSYFFTGGPGLLAGRDAGSRS